MAGRGPRGQAAGAFNRNDLSRPGWAVTRVHQPRQPENECPHRTKRRGLLGQGAPGGSGRPTVSSSPSASSGLERDKFDNKTVSFEEHIKFEHNMWNYLYFIVLVRVKNKTDYTGPESYVAQMIKVWTREERPWPPGWDRWEHLWKGRPPRSPASGPCYGGASELFCTGSVVRKEPTAHPSAPKDVHGVPGAWGCPIVRNRGSRADAAPAAALRTMLRQPFPARQEEGQLPKALDGPG